MGIWLTAGCQSTTSNPPDLVSPAPSVSAPSHHPKTMDPAKAAPTRVRIPSLGVDAHQVMQVDLDQNHQLQTPPLSKPQVVAWYRRSPAPGDVAPCSYADGCVGRSVLISHINGDGLVGAFAKLAQIKPGATVEVWRADGHLAEYKVTDVLIFEKTDFGQHQQEVYGDSPVPSLAMITCGPGDYDPAAHSYRQQTVVLANFVDFKPTP